MRIGALTACSCARQERPDALFIGLPPSYHGSIDDPKADIELQLAKVCISSLLGQAHKCPITSNHKCPKIRKDALERVPLDWLSGV